MVTTTIDLSSLGGSNVFRLDGEAAYNHLGYSVSNAGDVNGDGFDDLIVGAAGAAVQIATVGVGLAMTNAEFVVI